MILQCQCTFLQKKTPWSLGVSKALRTENVLFSSFKKKLFEDYLNSKQYLYILVFSSRFLFFTQGVRPLLQFFLRYILQTELYTKTLNKWCDKSDCGSSWCDLKVDSERYGKRPKKKNQNVNFFQIGLDPPPP